MKLKKGLSLLLSGYLSGFPLHLYAAPYDTSKKVMPTPHTNLALLKVSYSPDHLELDNERFAVTATKSGQHSSYSIQAYNDPSNHHQIKLKKLTISPSVTGSSFIEYQAITNSNSYRVMVERTPAQSRAFGHSFPHQPSDGVPLNIKKSITASGSAVFTTSMADNSVAKITLSPVESRHSIASNASTIKHQNSTNEKESKSTPFYPVLVAIGGAFAIFGVATAMVLGMSGAYKCGKSKEYFIYPPKEGAGVDSEGKGQEKRALLSGIPDLGPADGNPKMIPLQPVLRKDQQHQVLIHDNLNPLQPSQEGLPNAREEIGEGLPNMQSEDMTATLILKELNEYEKNQNIQLKETDV